VSTSRRRFLQATAAATGAAALGGALPRTLDAATAGIAPAPRALRILILGGTGFTGPHQVQYADARGHHITVFNRGRREADLPASVVHLQGDRNEPDGAGWPR
jgi:2'-hydroxyisoflavone reductase